MILKFLAYEIFFSCSRFFQYIKNYQKNKITIEIYLSLQGKIKV